MPALLPLQLAFDHRPQPTFPYFHRPRTAAHGVCAAVRIELPARFVWRAYRAVLGPAAVPAVSPLD